MSSWSRSLKLISGQGKRVNIALGQDCKCILLSLPSKCELFLIFFPIMVRKECIGQINDYEVIDTFASKDATRDGQLQLDYSCLVEFVVIHCHSSEFVSFFKASSELNEDVMEIIILLSLRSLIKVLQFMLVPLACDSFLESALEKNTHGREEKEARLGSRKSQAGMLVRWMPWLTPWGPLGVEWPCRVVPSWGEGTGLYSPVLTEYWIQDV